MRSEREVNVMVEDAYASLTRRAYQDFESGDLDLLGVVMGQDVVWHEPGRSSLAGEYKGLEAVLGFLGQLKARSGGTFRAEILDLFSEPERVVVLQRETAVRSGKALDEIAAVDFEIHHGKITEVTSYHADTYKFDEFWGDGEQGDESGQDYEIGWGDIESELYCSSREACIGGFSFPGT
ncbi:MAG: nuclear transport factor 2 family protein [Acidimicrobiales bacterium]